MLWGPSDPNLYSTLRIFHSCEVIQTVQEFGFLGDFSSSVCTLLLCVIVEGLSSGDRPAYTFFQTGSRKTKKYPGWARDSLFWPITNFAPPAISAYPGHVPSLTLACRPQKGVGCANNGWGSTAFWTAMSSSGSEVQEERKDGFTMERRSASGHWFVIILAVTGTVKWFNVKKGYGFISRYSLLPPPISKAREKVSRGYKLVDLGLAGQG